MVVIEWSLDNVTWNEEPQIGTVLTDADGEFEGRMAFNGNVAHIEYLRAHFRGDASYPEVISAVRAQQITVLPPWQTARLFATGIREYFAKQPPIPVAFPPGADVVLSTINLEDPKDEFVRFFTDYFRFKEHIII